MFPKEFLNVSLDNFQMFTRQFSNVYKTIFKRLQDNFQTFTRQFSNGHRRIVKHPEKGTEYFRVKIILFKLSSYQFEWYI